MFWACDIRFLRRERNTVSNSGGSWDHSQTPRRLYSGSQVIGLNTVSVETKPRKTDADLIKNLHLRHVRVLRPPAYSAPMSRILTSPRAYSFKIKFDWLRSTSTAIQASSPVLLTLRRCDIVSKQTRNTIKTAARVPSSRLPAYTRCCLLPGSMCSHRVGNGQMVPAPKLTHHAVSPVSKKQASAPWRGSGRLTYFYIELIRTTHLSTR